MAKTNLIILLLSFCYLSSGQEDPVLISIEEDPVYVSEFTYIYEKNNRDKADYSRASVEEYLQLYSNFKLKVRKAKDLKYNLQESYINELSGYRKQLSNGYVYDREVIDYLTEELYERKKYDIKLSHILIKTSNGMTVEEQFLARKKLDVVKDLLKKGESFEDLARQFSEDSASVPFGGDIGYITSLLPDGYLELEDAAYALDIDEVSDIVRTDLGFHLIKVTDRRPARGMIQAQHILIRGQKNGFRLADSERRIKEIHKRVTTTRAQFEDLAKTLSEDAKTAPKGGSLGYFGIGRYEASFEDAAFALKNDGDISEPFETTLGWHIVKRTGMRDPESRAQIKELLKGRLAGSQRVRNRQREFVESIKKTASYSWNRGGLKIFSDSLDESFLEYNWKVPVFEESELIAFGNDKYMLTDFARYCRSNSRIRLRAEGRKSLEETVGELFNSFVEEKAMEFAQSRLEDQYPDFKNLMREYEEGILLFEITKNEVWDKASNDTLGLKLFYEQNKERYNWDKRVQMTEFTIDTVDKNKVAEIFADIRKMNSAEILDKYNVPHRMITTETDTWEMTSDVLKEIPMVSGHVTLPVIDEVNGRTTCKKVEKILPPSPKTLKEARGYIVSDYQELLERQWLERLNDEYRVVINEEVLNALVVSQ